MDAPRSAAAPQRSSLRLEILLGALYGIAPISIDMYLPAMPAIALDLKASPASIQLSLAAFFLGFALGQLGAGPIIDRFGRRRPLLIGLALYVLASLGCTLASSSEMLIACRFLQAFSGAVAVVVPRALVRDLHSGAEAARMLSQLMLVMGVGPILAPLLGGYLLTAFGWRAIFGALALAGVCLFIGAFSGLRAYDRPLPQTGTLLKTLRDVLREPEFVRYGLAGGLCQAAMFAYIAGSSFAFIDVHGLTPGSYSLTFGLNSAGLIACTQLNRRLLRTVPPKVILRRGTLFSAAAGLTLLVITSADFGGPWLLGAGLFFFVASLGFIFPTSTALALEHHGARAGVASSVLGAGQFTLAALATALAGALQGLGTLAMGLVIACSTLLAVLFSGSAKRA